MKKAVFGDKKKGLVSSKNSVKYLEICGISYFGSGVDRLLKILSEEQKNLASRMWVTTINPEFVMAMEKDSEFADIINKSDIKLIDGIGLVWANEVLKSPKGLERWWSALITGIEILSKKKYVSLISGADLMLKISKLAAKKKQKVFLLGGWENRASESGEFLVKSFPGLKYDSCEGEPEVENGEVIKKINRFKPDYLFVAYGMKRQEEWIEKNIDKLNVKVVIGVGRSFDYYSGALKRAPKWIRGMGLEWLYSLFKEPKRWKRQMVLPKFIWMILTKAS
jgi:N-acetylglucosaminyldiphosphoundecaprenol N-acetyl-beta-D-mannosaminyltransferase